MARGKREPSESTVSTSKGASGAAPNGAAESERLEDFLEPKPSAAPSHDPAAHRGPTPQMDYYREAQERLKEAGICLRQFLFANPLAVEELDDLEEALIKATVGWRVLDRGAQKAGEIRKAEREERRRNMKREAYPSVTRGQFDFLGRTPDHPGE